MILWRISNYPDLTGMGGLLHPGRWHSRGRPVVYLAESAAGALLEALVHIEAVHPSELPRSYQLVEVEILEREADDLATTQDCLDLPEGWQNDPVITRRIGDPSITKGILDKYRGQYSVSIEDFGNRMQRHRQCKEFNVTYVRL